MCELILILELIVIPEFGWHRDIDTSILVKNHWNLSEVIPIYDVTDPCRIDA